MRTERSDNKKMEEEGSSSGSSSGGSGKGTGKGYISYYTGKKYEDLLISFSFPREFYI